MLCVLGFNFAPLFPDPLLATAVYPHVSDRARIALRPKVLTGPLG